MGGGQPVGGRGGRLVAGKGRCGGGHGQVGCYQVGPDGGQGLRVGIDGPDGLSADTTKVAVDDGEHQFVAAGG